MNECTTTKRKHFSPRERLRIWEEHEGVCCICGRKIDGTREGWIIEHIRALVLTGSNNEKNLAPAHSVCAKTKTREDLHRAAKAKRQKQRHIGIKKQGRPLPGTKRSGWKHKMDGTWVRR